MSARIRWSIGSIAFVSALMVSNPGIGAPADTANTADCLSAPNASTPEGSHWYYRTNHTTQRKCWYLRVTDQPAQGGAAADAHDPAVSDALAVKPLAPQRHARLSDKEVAKLYAEFLEWRRNTRYGDAGHQ